MQMPNHHRRYVFAVAARIPWLPSRSSSVQFCRSAFFKRFIANNETTPDHIIQRKLGILHTWDAAFPHYLPAWYHTMDGLEIQKNSLSARYFINAIHFVRSTLDDASLPFYNLKQKTNYTEKLADEDNANLTLKNKPEVCRTPAEYLLEPWVLIQLPFQPALLHQWAVAALAETLRYCKRLVEIGSRGYAPQFHDLYTKMAELSQVLTKNCNWLICTFFKTYCGEPALHVHTNTRGIMTALFETLLDTVARLEFILGDKCTNIIDSIKHTSWSKSFSPGDLMMSLDLSEIGFTDIQLEQMGLLNVYNLSYWIISHCFSSLCMGVKEEENTQSPCLNVAPNSTKATKRFVRQTVEKIIKSSIGGLKDTTRFICQLESNMGAAVFEFVQQMCTLYKQSKETSSTSAGFVDGYGAIISEILGLQSDIQEEKTFGRITRQVWLAAKAFDQDVYLSSDDSPPVQQSIQDAMETITDMVTRGKENWRTKIMEKADPASIETEREPADINNGIEETLKLRIRTMVSKMHQKHYTMLNTVPFPFFPECLVVQYILPCFVALLKDIRRDSTVDDRGRVGYICFLGMLVQSYKEKEYIQPLEDYRKLFFNSNTFCFYKYVARLVGLVGREATNLFRNSYRSYLSPEEVEFMYMHFANTGATQDRMLSVLYSPSTSMIQQSWLLSRMEKVLQKMKLLESTDLTLIIRDMLPAMVIIQGQVFDSDQLMYLRFANEMTKKGLGLNGKCEFTESKTKNVSSAVVQQSKKLTTAQLFGISIFHAWSSVKMSQENYYQIYQGPIFTLDVESDVASKIIARDWWGLKKIVARFSKGTGLIPMQLAKKNLCTKHLLKSLVDSRKVKMSVPGEVTFFPVQHCRWCGTVHAYVFRLCPECKDEPTYPDPTYFCSEKCEKDALEKFHAEEHATFVMEKLGL